MNVKVEESEDGLSYLISAITLEDNKSYFVVERVDNWDTINREVISLF